MGRPKIAYRSRQACMQSAGRSRVAGKSFIAVVSFMIAIRFQPVTRGRAKIIQGAEGHCCTNGSVQPRGCTGLYRHPVWSNEPSRQVMTCLAMV
ncbi:hypothetical protein [Caldicoprobacter faecalis]|uniref:hypothetical protein n=1 Tax=Caldicoprobacter faecalis TaxID=937334 RepID=UPI0011604E6F|nr:hypothetical protein [Caldicoprobacter faecalis]